MEREIEKDLIQIESAIKSQTEKDNMFTVAVLQRCYRLVSELKEYKGLEEQGKLLKLPCAVGDVEYRVNKAAKKMIAMRVQDIKVSETGGTLSMKIGCVEDIYGGECIYLAGEIGGMVFLTREDAETALKGEDEE